MRNFFGIVFLILSGFFVYTVCLLAFFDSPDVDASKIVILGSFCIPLLIFHSIGLALYRGANWRVSTGITFVVGSLLNVFVVMAFFSIKASPEIAGTVDMHGISAFDDYLTGFFATTLFLAGGAVLYFSGRTAEKS